MAAIDEALARWPTDVGFIAEKARILQRLGRLEEAGALLKPLRARPEGYVYRRIVSQAVLQRQYGEAIGVFCKAVGLKRPLMIALWRALRRPNGDPDSTDNSLGRAVYVFDTLATAKAQTVLRYWNWSFTAGAPAPRSF